MPNCILRLLNTSKIYENESSLTVAQLLFLEAEDTSKPIHLYINSPGGSVTAGLAIYDTVGELNTTCGPPSEFTLDAGIEHAAPLTCDVLTEPTQYVSSPIHTYCIGQAASMGSLLLCAGEKGKRHCLPNASIMIHRISHPSLICCYLNPHLKQNPLGVPLARHQISLSMQRRFFGSGRH